MSLVAHTPPAHGKRRAVIEAVSPQIDDGSFPIKRVVGDPFTVEANVFADGHDVLRVFLLYRHDEAPDWGRTPMQPLGNDRWLGSFVLERYGCYAYSIQAHTDPYATWQRNLGVRAKAAHPLDVEFLIGAQLIEDAANRLSGSDRQRVEAAAKRLRDSAVTQGEKLALAANDDLARLIGMVPAEETVTRLSQPLCVWVEPLRARFSTWYELFPRSAGDGLRHGTLRDVERRLDLVAELGFDILYLPPIHPIGRRFRKGKNNALQAEPDDVGSPWAIGSPEGGHKAIHPDLGTLADFHHLVQAARKRGIEIALDIALQCSPDHPYVREHPEWFRHRPDGTIQYAENPPKKYQDIVPFDFECDAWPALWQELASIFDYWMEQGVRVFRVDNPHTKPLHFWHWLLARLKQRDPQVILLAEAFTRPRVLEYLAKVGFTQSYNYFPWRNTKPEIEAYFTELTRGKVREYLRPNLWPNTPDILPEYLQQGGRPAFQIRLILAATLGASYGIYGPAFELCEHQAREPGSEEYKDSEKYQLRTWDWSPNAGLRPLIARINRIRKENPALQRDDTLRFFRVDNPLIICYAKHSAGNVILSVVNLDPHHRQAGWVECDWTAAGVMLEETYQVHDLLSDARFLWSRGRNYVELDPQVMPGHIFAVRRRVRRENDFDYYL